MDVDHEALQAVARDLIALSAELGEVVAGSRLDGVEADLPGSLTAGAFAATAAGLEELVGKVATSVALVSDAVAQESR